MTLPAPTVIGYDRRTRNRPLDDGLDRRSDMQARDLAEPYPTVTMGTPAVEAARGLAADRLNALVVVDERDHPTVVLPATQVLRLGLPSYSQDDPALARVIDEAHADVFLRKLAGRTLADCLPARTGELPVVNEDDTVLEIAALMARARSPLVVVVDRSGAMLGAITLHRLLDQVLTR
jgi:CBS domain-containing protein